MEDTAKSLKKAITDEFDGTLKAFGFKKARQRTEEFSFFIVYRHEERYICIKGNLHPRDYPFYYSMLFGEGIHEYPESAWNSISIIAIIESENPTDLEKCREILSISYEDSHEDIRQKFKAAREFLEKYGKSFLDNDLEQFYKIRTECNKPKTRFLDHVPQSDREYRLEYEMQVGELKKQLSKK
jgi:hypothetical protein